jgi:tetratricopeptide (TPR) repeat protein
LVSLLLHVAAVIFLFLFLHKATGNLSLSAFAAAFFALHPLRVESVAWAAELKDVLSMFFGMACLYVYAFYVERPKVFTYILCLISFLLALLSKPMLVTLPFVMLLLDYWPLDRYQDVSFPPAKYHRRIALKLLWEKIPFIIMSIASSAVTFWAQKEGESLVPVTVLPVATRLSNALISYVVYLKKIFWPVDLAVFYPYELSLPLWNVLISVLILIIITAIVLYFIRKAPFLFVGWFWYLGTLVPVIGFVQVGIQAMADRYTYLPSIGISMMLAWGVPLLFPRVDIWKKVLFLLGLICLAILAVLTWRQCGYWENSVTLFSHTIKVTKDNYRAYNLRGIAFSEIGRYQAAIDDFSEAIRMKSKYDEAYFNRGAVYYSMGQYSRAIEDYDQAINLKPHYVEALFNRGHAFNRLSQYQCAIADYDRVISLKGDIPDAYHHRGLAFNRLGQHHRSIENYDQAIRLKADYAEAYNSRGAAYYNLGKYQRAIEDYDRAIRLKADYAEAYNNRGVAYAKLGQYSRALEEFGRMISLNPNDGGGYANRARVYRLLKKQDLACRDAKMACALGRCEMLQELNGKKPYP